MYQKHYVQGEILIKQKPYNLLDVEALSVKKGIFDIKSDCYAENGVPFVRISNLKNMITEDDDIIYIPESEHRSNPETALRRNDLILSKTAYPAASLVTFDECNTSQDTIAIKLKQSAKVGSPYLVAFFNTSYGFNQMKRWFTGNIQMHLNLADSKNFLIPLLTWGFQLHIKDLFDKAFDKLEQSKALYAEAESLLLNELGLKDWQPPIDLSYEYKASQVFAVGRLDSEFFHPKYEWLETSLRGKFPVEHIGSWGKVLKGVSVEYTGSDEGVKIIRSGDLSDIEDDKKFLRASLNQKMFLLERGDVLISSIGFGSIGKIQIYDKAGKYGTVSEVTVIRQKRVNPYYLHFFLACPAGQMQIDHYITGATGQLHLYPKDVEHITVPIVSKGFETKLESLFKESRQLKKQAQLFLEIAKRGVEMAIERDEAEALAWMESAARDES